MATDVLLNFLNVGLIDVGGDDAKLARLQEATADLAADLKKNPSDAFRYTLAAFDPTVGDDNPVVRHALGRLQKRWITYVNTFAGTPIAIIRAMLLAALVEASSDDVRIALVIVRLGRNILPHSELANEESVWYDVMNELELTVDARAVIDWELPDSISVPAFEFDFPEPIKVTSSPYQVNPDAIGKKLDAAVGPQNVAQEATGGNQYWPNNGQIWAQQFSQRLTELLGEQLIKVAKGTVVEPLDIAPIMRSFAEAASVQLETTVKAVSGAAAGLQRRTNLIWWKEACYSPSARNSYRSFAPAVAATLMALDLQQQTPIFTPASVAAFLFEAVSKLPNVDEDEKRTVHQYLVELSASSATASIREEWSQVQHEAGDRVPLVALLSAAGGIPAEADFKALVGISPDISLTIPEWASWIYRELQALRATQGPGGSKRKGRKSA